MRYVNLLLDADDTLFDFPKASARAFSRMCQLHDIPDTPDVYQLYHQINLELWNAFDRGEVTKEFVTLERYVRFFDALHLKRDAAACNQDYLTALGECVYPLPHAEDVCRTLVSRGHRLYIITNAVASVQRNHLRGSAFADLITDAFISEDAGASKPPPHTTDTGSSGVPLPPYSGLHDKFPDIFPIIPCQTEPADFSPFYPPEGSKGS